jgi:hypothetical protein
MKLLKNKFAMCLCSPAMWWFSQLPLAALPSVLHAGVNHITVYVYEIFQPLICCIT